MAAVGLDACFGGSLTVAFFGGILPLRIFFGTPVKKGEWAGNTQNGKDFDFPLWVL